jgi:hypothetical protein
MRIDDFPADAWICEQHPDQPWPHPNSDEPDGQCAGPGMLRCAQGSRDTKNWSSEFGQGGTGDRHLGR